MKVLKVCWEKWNYWLWGKIKVMGLKVCKDKIDIMSFRIILI